MRLFIAINFDENFKSLLTEAADSLAGSCIKCRQAESDNIHLTLVFLGEMGSGDISIIKKAMEGCPREKIDIVTDGAGMFRGGDILFLNVKESKRLSDLYGALVKNLAALGIKTENRKYHPHITVAREAKLKGGFDMDKFNGGFKKLCYTAQSVELMLSERINGKMRYTPLNSVKFV